MHHNAHEAALLLWTCRQSGTVIDALPDALRPCDTITGHAIQAALPNVADSPVVGWKIAATSAAGQAHTWRRRSSRTDRGRDAHYWAPPAQIPACAIHALVDRSINQVTK